MFIPNDLLKDKNILLGVSGSIAVYKSLELVRLLVKAGANVKVVMSDASKKFVSSLSFETLSSNPVLDDTNESWVNEHNHIKAGQWADLFIVAPVTANTMAKLSQGIADNILLQCALAYPGTKLLAPSANTNMIENPITKTNLNILKNANYTLVDTQTKELACKTTGDGAMAEPINIFWACTRNLLENDFWKDRSVVVTGGGTIEKIDDVRYLSNFSSGKMASSLASALYCKGANVTLISTKFESNLPHNLNTIKVTSSNEMLDSINNSLYATEKKKTYLFMAAAVSDYIPSTEQKGKLKKAMLGEKFDLALKQNVDILSNINKEKIVTIGFKAEMDAVNAKDNASKMLNTKNLDAVCLNILNDSNSFGTDTNAIDFISASQTTSLPTSDKLSLAFQILHHAELL